MKLTIARITRSFFTFRISSNQVWGDLPVAFLKSRSACPIPSSRPIPAFAIPYITLPATISSTKMLEICFSMISGQIRLTFQRPGLQKSYWFQAIEPPGSLTIHSDNLCILSAILLPGVPGSVRAGPGVVHPGKWASHPRGYYRRS